MRQLEGQKVQIEAQAVMLQQQAEASKRREEDHTRIVTQLQQQLADSIAKERESSQIFQNHLLQSPRLQRPKLRGKI